MRQAGGVKRAPRPLLKFGILHAAGSSRAQYRDHLPAMTAIDAEVGIRREYHRIGHCLGHAHQASISKADRYACVFLKERYNGLYVVVQTEPRD